MPDTSGSAEAAARPAGIVVFDGVCNFCSATVRFLLAHDQAGRLSYAPLQSPLGGELMRRHGFDPAAAETFLFVRGERGYARSEAALEVAGELGRPWRWLRFLRVVPRGWRDGVYSWIARHRYRWLGRRETCFLPTPAQRARFLDTAREADGRLPPDSSQPIG